MNLFINSSIILAQFSDDFAVIFDTFSASILVSIIASTLSIFRVPAWTLGTTFWDKAPPENTGRFPSGPPNLATRARHGAENCPNTVLIDSGVIFGRGLKKLRNDEGGNDKTTPPFGKTFLRLSEMRASALNENQN